MTESTIITGKTPSGIEFKIDSRIKDDARFLYYLAKAQDENGTVDSQSKAVMGMLSLIFGDDDGVLNFMNAVAAVNDGVCNVNKMLGELMEIFNALNVKN